MTPPQCGIALGAVTHTLIEETIHREENAWRRGGTEEGGSSWRESRREDTDRGDRGERRDKDRRDDREIRAPPRENDEGKDLIYDEKIHNIAMRGTV